MHTLTILEQLVSDSVRLRPRTKAIYLDAVARYLQFVGTANPAEWTGQSVVDWRNALVATGTLKAQSVDLLLKGLRYSTKRWAEVERNPALDFARVAELLKPDPKEKRVSLTMEQAKALISACDGNTPYDRRDRAMLVLMIRTGTRRAGVCGAVLEKLDTRMRKLTIELKGGEPHELDLDSETVDALHAWTSWLAGRGVRTGRIFRSLRPSLSSSASEIGVALSPQRLYEIVHERAERAERAGIGHVFPHRLRHSFVSIALDNGIEEWRIRQVTGHKRQLQLDDYATDLRAQRGEPVSALLPSLRPSRT